VGAFNSDVRDNQGYRYTTSASYSSFVANRRMTDATLQHIAPMAKRALDAGCGDGTYTNYIKGEILVIEPAALKDLPVDVRRRLLGDHADSWSAITIPGERNHLIVYNLHIRRHVRAATSCMNWLTFCWGISRQ